ncbi:MAG: nitrous oxide reductase family maturation protein NosD [Ferruginibacter sp.]
MKKLFIILTFLLASTITFANKILVGKNQVISSLKTAISLAVSGDTILLHKGVYKEGNMVVNKRLSIIGIDMPVLDGENKYEILTISGSDILVKGIHFRNSGFSSMNDYASINIIDAARVTVTNNRIDNAHFAIHIGNARHCRIYENNIYGNAISEQTSGNGIHFWKCDSMYVNDNFITKHRDGIYFEFVTNSIISNNTSQGNIRYGLHFMFSNHDTYINNIFKDNGAGVAVMFSHHVLMMRNIFDHNWGPNAYGLLLKEISDATIARNTFVENTVGILMEGTNRINAWMNNFTSNGWAMRIQASCDQNKIELNNFQGNTFDVATNGTHNSNSFSANYWDKYEGYDMNRDKIGDIPYHPVSMYSMVIEQNPHSLILLRSFMVSLLDKAEKAIPSLTPEFLKDDMPSMKALKI